MSKLVNFRANLVEFRVQGGHFLFGTQCPNYRIFSNSSRVIIYFEAYFPQKYFVNF